MSDRGPEGEGDAEVSLDGARPATPSDAAPDVGGGELRAARAEIARLRSELDAARAAAAHEHSRYQSYFEFAPDGYLVTDAGGLITDANEVASLTLNVPRRYLPGKALALFVAEEDRDRYWVLLRRLRRGEAARDWAFTLVSRGGDRYRVTATVAAERAAGGEVAGFRWMVRSPEAAPPDGEVALALRPWPAADRAPASAPDRSRRVIVAVHDTANRERIARWLSRHWDVSAVADADAALAAARSAPAHLLLADVALERSGEIALALHEDARTRHMPVIAYAAAHGPPCGWAAQAVDEIVEEPVGERDLVARVGVRLDAGRVRRDERARMDLLIEAGAALSAELDLDHALRAVARFVVPAAADYCRVDLLEGDRLHRVAAVRHGEEGPASEPADAADAADVAVDERSRLVFARVAALGVAVIGPPGGIAPEPGSAAAELVRAELGGLAAESYVSVPLMRRGRTLGTLTLATGTGRVYRRSDVPFVEELGRRVVLAVDNAQLYGRAVAATVAADAARRDAERANDAKTMFLATMSHELRTPLNAIAGYTELLDMGLRGPVTGAQREDLQRIRRSQRHLLGLIENVLGYASLDAGHLSLQVEAVALDEVLREAADLVGPEAEAREVAFVVRLPETAPRVRADRGRLVQVVVNLLANAIKFTEAGGRVECAVRELVAYHAIDVEDTGRGVPAHMLEAVFQPFVQADADLTRGKQGTGLGLAISRSLARAMGGDITLESAEGTGSTFTVLVPRDAS